MKKVVSTDQVAHLWANQLQDEARNSRNNFYYYGLKIYSYGGHFCIAAIDPNKTNTVFFTTRGYSNTTAMHINIVRSACSHKERIYCKYPEYAANGTHSENINAFEQEAKNWAAYLDKARKPEKYLIEITRQREELTKYCNYFNLDIKSFDLSHIFIESKADGAEAREAERKKIEDQRKKNEERKIKEAKESLRKFRAFKSNRIYGRYNNLDYLRYNDMTERIETSQGVEIPVLLARKFYYWVKTTIKNGGCKDSECKMNILDYEVKAVNNKLMIIGCHNIEIKEADRIAKLLKW